MTPCCAVRDHPRIRGEHHSGVPELALLRGSSPHTRGAPSRRVRVRSPHGIIPAYAGSTLFFLAQQSADKDHPRIRGEHLPLRYVMRNCLGSSPHTRGALDCKTLLLRVSGIIPAYAGSTKTIYVFPSVRRDHPRIRGEHFLTCFELCV